MLPYIIAGIAAILITDTVVTGITGKHLHEHLFEWWCELRDTLQRWLSANQRLGVRAVGLTVLDALDHVAVRTKQTTDMLTLGMWGMDAQENGYEIATREVPLAEAMRLFPELRQSHTTLVQNLSR